MHLKRRIIMKTKILKATALTLAVVLILGVLIFANSLLGNPLSKAIARKTAEDYVAQTYKDTDYELTDVYYELKDGYYHATVKSESSIDTSFELWINGFGKLKHDNYDYFVTSGWNTALRIDLDYRNTTKALFESSTFPYNAHVAYGELMFVAEENKDAPSVVDYAFITNELTIDAYYNASELGKSSGKLTVYVDDEHVSVERMAEILLGIRECFDEAGVGFYAIDCVLEYPQVEGSNYEYGQIEVVEFLYSDIYEDGLVERVTEANEAAKVFFGTNKEDSIE